MIEPAARGAVYVWLASTSKCAPLAVYRGLDNRAATGCTVTPIRHGGSEIAGDGQGIGVGELGDHHVVEGRAFGGSDCWSISGSDAASVTVTGPIKRPVSSRHSSRLES